jgi:tryptophan 2,3-dioxygenase
MKPIARVRTGDQADHLYLDILLKLQHPRVSVADPRAYGDEHFFIVARQCTELLLRQVLVDLESAVGVMTSPAGEADLHRSVDNLYRAAELMRLLGSWPTGLRSIRGAQSAQLGELRSVLGLAAGRDGVLMEAFRELVDATGRALEDVFTTLSADHVLCRLAEALLGVADAASRCLPEHGRTVEPLWRAWPSAHAEGV